MVVFRRPATDLTVSAACASLQDFCISMIVFCPLQSSRSFHADSVVTWPRGDHNLAMHLMACASPCGVHSSTGPAQLRLPER